jgi:transposase
VISSNSSAEETGGAVPKTAAVHERVAPDPAPRPTRRSFTAAYKLAVVAEYEAAPHGEKGAVLRREGLHHSHIKEWTRARDVGARSGLADVRKSAAGSKGSAKDRGEVERLRAQNVRLTAQLAQTRTALDIMGKAHVLLEMLSESTDTSTPSKKS